jgi:hypothetical protein
MKTGFQRNLDFDVIGTAYRRYACLTQSALLGCLGHLQPVLSVGSRPADSEALGAVYYHPVLELTAD